MSTQAHPHISPEDIEHCRKIAKRYGTSYYFATRFFPRKLRQATWVLYAWVRLPDEIVDGAGPHAKAADVRAALIAWREKWHEAERTKHSDEPVLRSAAKLFDAYGIPREYGEAFLDAMLEDTVKRKYRDYEDLRRYMYGSAAVVGLMMAHIIGFTDKAALGYAEELGYAMQLTNFLRDIKEDYELRRRIYLPQDEMVRFGVLEIDISEGHFDAHMKELLRSQIARARAMFRESIDGGVPLLRPEGRRAVVLARVLYEAILDEIERRGYNVYSGRARVGTLRKLFLALPYFFKKL